MCPKDLSVLVALSSSPLVYTFHILVFFIRPLKVVDVLQTKPMHFFNIRFIPLHCASKLSPLARQAIYCPRLTVSDVSAQPDKPSGQLGECTFKPHKIFPEPLKRVPQDFELLLAPIHFWPVNIWPVSGANCMVKKC